MGEMTVCKVEDEGGLKRRVQDRGGEEEGRNEVKRYRRGDGGNVMEGSDAALQSRSR